MARPTKLFSDYLIIFEEKHADKYTYHEDTYINSITEMKMICPIHGEFWQKPSNHANGKGCKKCGLVSMKNKLIYSNTEITNLLENTHELNFIDRCIKIHGNKYNYSQTIYTKMKDTIKIICPEHGLFEQKAMNHVNGKGCKQCTKYGKLTKENLIKKLTTDHDYEFDFKELKVDYKTSDKLNFICKIHGPTTRSIQNLINGKGCRKCSQWLFINVKEIQKEYKWFPHKIEWNSYNGKTKKIDFHCKTHGLVSRTFSEYIKSGYKCPKCSYSAPAYNSLSEEEHQLDFNRVHNNRYTYNFHGKNNSKDTIEIFCKSHNSFWQEINSHKTGSGCPKCSTTKAELNLLNTFPDFIHRDKKLINKEIDLLNHEHKFGIEYNGLLWHSFGKYFPNNLDQFNKNKHLEKTILMEQKGYQLFHIKDIDWDNPIKKEIWLSVINSKLGKTNRIYARKTKVVDLTEHRMFVNEYLLYNHLQGIQNYSYAYGLEYDGRIYSIMTFGKPIEDSSEWELKRFCNFRNTTIVGGASKLLNYFEKIHNPKSLISYAKRDWSQGNLYKKIGLEFIENTPPSIFWFNPKNQTQYSRQKFQKHKLPKLFEQGFLKTLEGSTAQEIMFNNGFRIYYDSGNKKYKKIYKENK